MLRMLLNHHDEFSHERCEVCDIGVTYVKNKTMLLVEEKSISDGVVSDYE